MFKKIQLDLIIAITTFFTLVSLILLIYNASLNKHFAVIENNLMHTGKLISKEFGNIVHSDISWLENIRSRLEHTDGAYFNNWEHDANLLLKQNNSFKFIEWIDSLMIIRKINPLKGNEQALNLDISKIGYRKDTWLNHAKTGKTNITSWVNLTQSGQSFLVDVPVNFQNRFQGTITAGMNFNSNFNRLVHYLDKQYTIEVYDDKNVLFYTINEAIKQPTKRNLHYSSTITIDAAQQKIWRLNIYPTKNLLLAEKRATIDIALAFGLFMAIIIASLIYFYLQAINGRKRTNKINASLKKLNKQLSKEKNKAHKASKAKTDFLSNMSHEIRTPLHAIIGLIELLKDEGLNDTSKEYVDLMDKSSSNLLGIVNDILEIEKIESGITELDKQVFCPTKKIKELIEVNHFLFVKKNLYLKTNFENTNNLTVIGDAHKMLQVVNNVLKNALKFTKEGGVSITCEETIIENKLQLIVTIEDTGIGIPKNKISTIFNRFTQIENSVKKQYEGSGLGLAICKNLVAMMDGDIVVESEYHKGSKFTVSFMFDITYETIKHDEHKINIDNTHINALLVDDNKLNIIVLKKFLLDIGIPSDTAENGKIALEKIQDNNYQLIFMDIHMPEMDGWEATRIIRQTNKDVIIFGLSANVTSEAINKALESGMNNYLTKPFKKEPLYKLLQFHFNIGDQNHKKTQ
ncbi:ATP-binding protein [Mariniflexile maritimum]|uniref:ATP-binding protein n=1 Tax=Mariniflexile maritimum TaxID=2682493 RepID=UPI0012F67EBE|nr:ATP-binding protein [Mariniflexile maritimum]